MTPKKVIREMRDIIQAEAPGRRAVVDVEDLQRWADALEQAMNQPAFTLIDGMVATWSASYPPPPIGTKFYPLPPDAAAEIERLKRAENTQHEAAAQMRRAWVARGAEIDRLRKTLQSVEKNTQ